MKATTRAPLTTRIIGALPGTFWVWVVIWAALVPLRPLINVAVLQSLGDLANAADLLERIAPTHVVLGFIVALALAGTRLLWQRAQEAEAAIRKLDKDEANPAAAFRGLGSSIGTLAVLAIFIVVPELGNFAQLPLLDIAIDVPMLAFVALPLADLVWSYSVVLFSVDRLGRRALALDPFPEDRSLGLRSVGALTFTGYAILSLAALLYLIFLGHYVTDIVIGAAVFVFGTALFVLSMWRLHRQMSLAKQAYVRRTRRLYVNAYEPLRDKPTLDILERQAALLGAAEALERRAESILEWPIDDRMARGMAIIVTGVLTSLVVRAILIPFGL